jgi:hypothetical protein
MVVLHLLNPKKIPLDGGENMKRRRTEIDDARSLQSMEILHATSVTVINDKALDAANHVN